MKINKNSSLFKKKWKNRIKEILLWNETCLKIFVKRYTHDYIYSMRFEPLLIPLKINSPNLRWNSFSVDRAVNLRDPVNLQESFADKSRWTVRDLSEDLSVEDPVPLFMLQFVDDQIRFEWQTLFAPIFDKPIRIVSRSLLNFRSCTPNFERSKNLFDQFKFSGSRFSSNFFYYIIT